MKKSYEGLELHIIELTEPIWLKLSFDNDGEDVNWE